MYNLNRKFDKKVVDSVVMFSWNFCTIFLAELLLNFKFINKLVKVVTAARRDGARARPENTAR